MNVGTIEALIWIYIGAVYALLVVKAGWLQTIINVILLFVLAHVIHWMMDHAIVSDDNWIDILICGMLLSPLIVLVTAWNRKKKCATST